MNIVENAIVYAKDFFEKDSSGHDFYHTLRVYNLAKTIAEKEECDKEIVHLGALLHDVDDYKIVGVQSEPYLNAKTFLRSQNYPEDKIEFICHIISQVSFKGDDTVTPDSIEGMIVQDADRLDAIGAIGVSRVFTYGGGHGIAIHDPEVKPRDKICAEEYYKSQPTSINHFYEKMLKLKDLMNTESAKKMAEHRHKYLEDFLKEFFDEWEGII